MIQITPRKFIKTLSILHLAFTIAPATMIVFVYFTNPESTFDYNFSEDVFIYLVPIVAISGIVLGNFLYTNKIKGLLKLESLKQKLFGFQTASIIKYATIEGPALLGLVAFMQTRNLIFLAIAGVLVFYLLSQRPSKVKIEQDLQLDFEHKNELNHLDKLLD